MWRIYWNRNIRLYAVCQNSAVPHTHTHTHTSHHTHTYTHHTHTHTHTTHATHTHTNSLTHRHFIFLYATTSPPAITHTLGRLWIYTANLYTPHNTRLFWTPFMSVLHDSRWMCVRPATHLRSLFFSWCNTRFLRKTKVCYLFII